MKFLYRVFKYFLRKLGLKYKSYKIKQSYGFEYNPSQLYMIDPNRIKYTIEDRTYFNRFYLGEIRAGDWDKANELMVEAIDEYIKLQYDPLIDEYGAMCDQSFAMTKIYRSIVPTEKNLEDLTKLQVEMGKAAKARDAHKELILKDQETEANIQGTDSSDFTIFEQELLNGGA